MWSLEVDDQVLPYGSLLSVVAKWCFPPFSVDTPLSLLFELITDYQERQWTVRFSLQDTGATIRQFEIGGPLS
jgi:hypothetical protein